MKREDFKTVAKFYSTTNLVYILYNGIIIDYVETYKDLFFIETPVDSGNWDSQKKKRKPQEITDECEVKINKYIKANS